MAHKRQAPAPRIAPGLPRLRCSWCRNGDVHIELSGTDAELLAVGIDDALLGGGRKGVHRTDPDGDGVLRMRRRGCLRLWLRKPVQRARRIPGVADWIARNPRLSDDVLAVWRSEARPAGVTLQ